MLQIDADRIREALPVADCIEIVEGAMAALSAGLTDQPDRWLMKLEGGNAMGIMPGAMRDRRVHGIKLISLYPGNPARGLSSHQGVMLLFDSETGTPIAALDAAELTALRTAAATAAATRALARADSTVLAILGTGEQADHHLPALLCVRPFSEVRVWSRRPERSAAFVERHAGACLFVPCGDVREAIAGADVIVSVTASPVPVIAGEWLESGQHLNLVGSSVASAREIDDAGVARGRFFVDCADAAASQAGEWIGALASGAVEQQHLLGEIGAVYSGRLAGRRNSEDITIYKSLGTAAQDIAAGYEIWRRISGASSRQRAVT